MATRVSRARIGREFFLLVDLNESTAIAGEKWAKVSSQKDGGLSHANESVDTTTKDDAGYMRKAVITKGWSASFGGNLDIHGPAMDLLLRKQGSQTETAFELHVKLRDAYGGQWVGWAIAESFEWSFGVDEVATYSISLSGNGPLERRSA
jgi:TP901-1 family phage major tail protein